MRTLRMIEDDIHAAKVNRDWPREWFHRCELAEWLFPHGANAKRDVSEAREALRVMGIRLP